MLFRSDAARSSTPRSAKPGEVACPKCGEPAAEDVAACPACGLQRERFDGFESPSQEADAPDALAECAHADAGAALGNFLGFARKDFLEDVRSVRRHASAENSEAVAELDQARQALSGGAAGERFQGRRDARVQIVHQTRGVDCRAGIERLAADGADVEEIDLDLSFGSDPYLRLRGEWMVAQQFRQLDHLDEFDANLAGNAALLYRTVLSAADAAGEAEQVGTTPIVPAVGRAGFLAPVPGASVTGPGGAYGACRAGCTRSHAGIDLPGRRGTAVGASAAGIVTEAGAAAGYGLRVTVDHGDGWATRYAHLDRLMVRQGESVRAGQQLGTMGDSGDATGVHLHYRSEEHTSELQSH